jgi:hypothetical protein
MGRPQKRITGLRRGKRAGKDGRSEGSTGEADREKTSRLQACDGDID